MNRILPLALLFALAGCASAQTADLAPPSDAGVRAFVAAHDEAWNAHDPEQLMALLAADPVTVTPTGVRVEGLEAHREMFSTPGPTKGTTASTEILGVQRLAPNLVVVDARQTLSGPGVAIIGSRVARVVSVLRWEQGAWKLVSARPIIPAARGGKPGGGDR